MRSQENVTQSQKQGNQQVPMLNDTDTGITRQRL